MSDSTELSNVIIFPNLCANLTSSLSDVDGDSDGGGMEGLSANTKEGLLGCFGGL